jgi:hypothetical protein
MNRPLGAVAGLLIGAAVCFPPPSPAQVQAVPSIRRVHVLRGSGQVEVEIETSDRVVPQTHAITSPDRLIVDFVNVIPSAQLRNQAINREEVKDLRVGLFSSDPPVTRIVLDLNGPQPYQVFPSGRTVILKIGKPGVQTAAYRSPSAPVLVNTNYPAHAVKIATPAIAEEPLLEVSFHDGLLSISSNKANLSEILYAVHQRTGAEIAIPAGAEQEKVMVELGPAPAPEVLAHLLNGSKFNFLILSSSTDPQALDQVILSPRGDGVISAPSRPQAQPANDEETAAQSGIAPAVLPQVENGNPPADGQPAPPAQPNSVPD